MAGATRTITVRLPEDLFAAIEDARGLVPREPWIRDALSGVLFESHPPEGYDFRHAAELAEDAAGVPTDDGRMCDA